MVRAARWVKKWRQRRRVRGRRNAVRRHACAHEARRSTGARRSRADAVCAVDAQGRWSAREAEDGDRDVTSTGIRYARSRGGRARRSRTVRSERAAGDHAAVHMWRRGRRPRPQPLRTMRWTQVGCDVQVGVHARGRETLQVGCTERARGSEGGTQWRDAGVARRCAGEVGPGRVHMHGVAHAGRGALRRSDCTHDEERRGKCGARNVHVGTRVVRTEDARVCSSAVQRDALARAAPRAHARTAAGAAARARKGGEGDARRGPPWGVDEADVPNYQDS